ncbi:MAG: ABC transporter substrate-binding protein [Pelagimonas sp.]|jgi:phospholipid transport system substrate-binding protein|nr:ABC transporter substrate-binding protein [Pelagimonas sp.]
MKTVTRRGFVASAAALSLIPGAALALNEAQARGLVDQVVGQINAIIDAGKPVNAMLGDFERLFKTYGDTSYIAAFTLGADGRRASAAQKKAYSKAFISYMSRKYGRRFNEFKGARLETKSVKRVKNYYEVKTTAFLRGQSPFEVNFHVSDRSGQNKFFNMHIEGVNLLLTERTEIGSMLDKRRGNIDALIKDLRKAG